MELLLCMKGWILLTWVASKKSCYRENKNAIRATKNITLETKPNDSSYRGKPNRKHRERKPNKLSDIVSHLRKHDNYRQSVFKTIVTF